MLFAHSLYLYVQTFFNEPWFVDLNGRYEHGTFGSPEPLSVIKNYTNPEVRGREGGMKMGHLEGQNHFL